MPSSGDEEILEISDFTVVTPWEELTSRLEAAYHDWDLADQPHAPDAYRRLGREALSGGRWETKSTTMTFGSLTYRLFHYKLLHQPSSDKPSSKSPLEAGKEADTGHLSHALLDLLHSTEPFPSGTHPIASEFGLRDWVLLGPASPSDQLFNESRRNLVLSALNVAAANARMELPYFLACRDPVEGIVFGGAANRNVRAELTTLRLHKHPPSATHLAGLVSLFRERIAATDPYAVRVAVQLRFRLHEPLLKASEAMSREAAQELPDLSSSAPSVAARLPFGLYRDPLDWMELRVAWPTMEEAMMVENDVYSDIDPLTAPFWRLSLAFSQGDECLLHELLRKWLELGRNRTGVQALLGLRDEDPALNEALGALTKAAAERAMEGRLPVGGSGSAQARLPLAEKDVCAWLAMVLWKTTTDAQVFRNEGAGSGEATAVAVSLQPPTPTKGPGRAKLSPTVSAAPEEDKDTATKVVSESAELATARSELASVKGAPEGSLTERLAAALSALLHSQEGRAALLQFWLAFVSELESFYDAGRWVPGLAEAEEPDHSAALLHQKLQMLQACIAAKKRRDTLTREAQKAQPQLSSDSEEEFYDAEDGDDEDEAASAEPQGRLKAFGDGETLCDYPERVLYVPVTQDAAPLTEDALEAAAERLVALGASAASAGERARAQSQALASDIAAFKAANPGASLPDFVRWHSPRDYHPDTGLSSRMRGGLWPELWAEAKAVPVHRQQRVFNDGKEAAAILAWLKGLTANEVVTLSLPMVMPLALRHLRRESEHVHGLIGDKLAAAARKAAAASHAPQDLDLYMDLLKDVAWVETTEAQFRSARSRLEGLAEAEATDLVLRLMRSSGDGGGGVPIAGGANSPLGRVVRSLFSASSGGKLPAPFAKEYLLRAALPRGGPGSRLCPQRLYARVGLQPRELRVASAFSRDITFF